MTKLKRKKRITKPIAFGGGVVTQEILPYPIVYYPGFYGTFFAFKQNPSAPLTFCSCAREAIENYVTFRLSGTMPENSDPTRMFVLDSMHFPSAVVSKLMIMNVSTSRDVIEHLQFQHRLCHECNQTVPNYRYCHEMYGTAFRQNFGWYINKQAYEYGVNAEARHITDNPSVLDDLPTKLLVLTERCPQSILDIWQLDPVKTFSLAEELMSADPHEVELLMQRLHEQQKLVWKTIENEVRRKFGHKNIGESWVSETILYHIVQSLFQAHTVLRHYRPDWLEGLELDIFIPDKRLGIEYQGIQHFQPVEHWGGKDSFKRLQQRDKRKAELCGAADIRLVLFDYDEVSF